MKKKKIKRPVTVCLIFLSLVGYIFSIGERFALEAGHAVVALVKLGQSCPVKDIQWGSEGLDRFTVLCTVGGKRRKLFATLCCEKYSLQTK